MQIQLDCSTIVFNLFNAVKRTISKENSKLKNDDVKLTGKLNDHLNADGNKMNCFRGNKQFLLLFKDIADTFIAQTLRRFITAPAM